MDQDNAAVKVYTPPNDIIEPAFHEHNVPMLFGCDDKFFPHAVTVIALIHPATITTS